MRVYTALLIDDDIDDHLFFKMAVERIDAVVKCEFAHDGLAALERLTDVNFKPDVILIDINMPRMNGLDCLREIKKIEHLKDVPVYMYSTSADSSLRQGFVKLGAIDVIRKLPSVALLRERLTKIFSELKTLVLF
jgi:CheY-like chemotaxis protein